MDKIPLSASKNQLQQFNSAPEQVDSFAVESQFPPAQSPHGGSLRSPSPKLLEELTEDDVSPLFPRPQRSGGLIQWFWLATFTSIGLHAAILLVPTGETTKPPPPKPPEQQVRITQLRNSIKQPKIKQPPKPTVKRAVAPTVNRSRVNVPPAPSVPAAPKPPVSAAKTEQVTGDNPWQDFPLYPGSTPGCFELPSCLQSSDEFSQVVAHFTSQLPAKKYTVKPAVQEPERVVFRVTRNGLTQFLSIIENGKNTVYVLSDAPRTIADLEKAVEVPPEIYAILVGLAVQQADSTAFAQPNQFYTKGDGKGLTGDALVPKPGIRNISLVPGQASDTMMDEFLRSNLQNSDFEVTDIPQSYGGGKVYRAQKGGQTLYLNLVPSKDNSGTLLVIWKTPPG